MLRTLATYVSAMGGSLHIMAQFPDGTASDLTIGATDAPWPVGVRRTVLHAPSNGAKRRVSLKTLPLRQPPSAN